MKEITRYTYLNLEIRPDRRFLATCNAVRDGIPDHLVDFWTGKWFETWDEIGRYAVEKHGFENFKRCIGQDRPIAGTPIGHMYNLTCYLTDRMTREGTLEVHLHDDTYFMTPLVGKAHAYLNDFCRSLQQHTEINMLLLDPFYLGPARATHVKDPPFFRPKDLFIGGSVYEGIKGACDFAVIFSAKGAEYLRDMLLNHPPWHNFELLLGIENWDLPGLYTAAFPLVKRFSQYVVGSNTIGS